ncbi:MAG: SpoIID/LytB domain-containing protein [Parcubacteria group bacterium]
MIAAKSKYLSYFWNKAEKAETGEAPAGAENSLLSVIGSVLFCFCLVAAASFGLSSIEKFIENRPIELFVAEAASAAEIRPEAQTADPSLNAISENRASNSTTDKPPADPIKNCSLKLKIANSTGNADNEACDVALGLPANGPLVRVGLYHTPDPISILNDQGWQIFDDQNKLLATVPAGKKITFAYSLTAGLPTGQAGKFSFTFENEKISTARNLILKNFNNGVFTIASLIDKNKRPAINFNRFGGDLEIKFFNKKDRVWVVESLPLENYLKGLKETSDNDPIEYQKSIVVAARTYALYHANKFAGQTSIFDVYADSRDQVYKGLNNAGALPHLAQIVDSTDGIVASYGDGVILAYYSARSGGKTTGVKNVPYLQSVAAPYTKSMKKWGHGLGIDMYDARERTKKDNWTYDQILNYYYTGIQLQKIY